LHRKDNSPLIAIDVVMNIIDSTHLVLAEHPRAGRQGRVKNTRELVIDGLPSIVIYREQVAQSCIEICRCVWVLSGSVVMAIFSV
jgi:plasmid stabilization system protein ParE